MKIKNSKATDEKIAISDYLVNIITTKGQEYLQTASYKIYLELIEKKIASSLYARMMLLTLLSGIQVKATELSNDVQALSLDIQKTCCLNSEMGTALAEVYSQIFSAENQTKWQKKTEAGFRSFCRKIWQLSWEDECVWKYPGGHMDCSGSGTATVKVIAPDIVKQEMQNHLAQNPFLTADEISAYFNDVLAQSLDSEFEEYCTDDDYYPPVVEDFRDNFDDVVNKFCSKFGLELVASDFDGYLSDYEPDDR